VPSDALGSWYELEGVKTVASAARHLLGIKDSGTRARDLRQSPRCENQFGYGRSGLKSVLNIDNPSLGPLLAEGTDYLESRYGLALGFSPRRSGSTSSMSRWEAR
jgi:hypothetical protein